MSWGGSASWGVGGGGKGAWGGAAATAASGWGGGGDASWGGSSGSWGKGAAGKGATKPVTVVAPAKKVVTAGFVKPQIASAKAVGGVPAAVPGKMTLNVTSKLSVDELVVRTVVGTFVEAGDNLGKKYFKKQEKIPDYPDLQVFLYYWDTRDGADFSGWWFGDAVGGTQVFARCPTHTALPPKLGWKVPWDAPKAEMGMLTVETLAAAPKAVMPAAKAPPANAAKLQAAIAGQAEKKQELAEIVAAQTAVVEEAIGNAREAITQLKAAFAGAEDADMTPEDAQQAVAATQEATKAVQAELLEETTKAKAVGPAGTGAYLSLTKLTPRLRTMQATMTLELAKVKGKTAVTVAAATDAKATIEKLKAAAAEKAAAAAEKAALDLENAVPAAQEALTAAEEAVEAAAAVAQPLIDDPPTEVDDGLTTSLEEIDKLCIEGTNKLVASGRAINAGLGAVKRAGVEKEENKERIKELTTMKAALDEAMKKLQPFKKVKADVQVKLKGALALKMIEDRVSDTTKDVEEWESKIESKKGETFSSEELAEMSAALAKLKTQVAVAATTLEARLKTTGAEAPSKDKLEELRDTAKENVGKIATLIGTLAVQKEASKREELVKLSKERLAKAEDRIAELVKAEAPFKKGKAALKGDELTKAVKTNETAATIALKSIGQAQGFVRQRIVDARRLHEDHANVVEEELKAIVKKVDSLNNKLKEMTKVTFEAKYSNTMSEVVSALANAEDIVEKFKGACEPLKDEGLTEDRMQTVGTKAQSIEKEASASVVEARKLLEAKLKERKGSNTGGTNILYGRLANITQDLVNNRKLCNGVDKIIKCRVAVLEEETKMKDHDEKVAEVAKIAADTDADEDAVLELETTCVSVLAALRASSKILEELSKVAPPPHNETVAELIKRGKAATKSLGESREKTKDKRYEVLSKQFAKDVEAKLDEIDAAIESAGDAELPFLSGVEVLPVAEATETLTKCDKATIEVTGFVSKLRTFIATKSVEVRKYGTDTAKEALEEVTKLQERLKGQGEKMTKFKKDVASHRRKADAQEAIELFADVDTEVDTCKDSVKTLEAEEDADKAKVDKVIEEVKGTQAKIDQMILLVLKCLKDPAKDKEQEEALKELKKKADEKNLEMKETSKVATGFHQKILGKQLLVQAAEKITEAEKELEGVTKACAPLLEQGGEQFLVQAGVGAICEALTEYMKANDGTTEETLFKKANGGKATGSINEKAFGKFVEGLNALLSREDMEFEEGRRTAMFKLVAGEEKGISSAAFKNMFRRKYSVVKNITLTSAFEIATGKTVAKLVVGDILEALGEAKKEASTGMMRMECKLLSKDKSGFVTTLGNQGSGYLEVISHYTTFCKDCEKQIAAAAKTGEAVVAFIKTSMESLGNSADASIKEAKGELMKIRPKATTGIIDQCKKLKLQMSAGQKEYAKKEAAERRAHLDKKDRLEAEAITGPLKGKIEAFTAAFTKFEETCSPLTSLKAPEQKNFATPTTLQKECEAASAVLKDLVTELSKDIKEALEKIPKTATTGPLADAKKSLTETNQKVVGSTAKRNVATKSIAAICKSIGEASYGKLQKALRDDVQGLGMSLDKYFDKLAGGKPEIAEEALTKHAESLEGDLSAEHVSLACRRLGAGSIKRRRFMDLLQIYYIVSKEIAVTPESELTKDVKPIRKAVVGEILELIEGPTLDENEMTRLRGRLLKDGTEGWLTLGGNKGTPFLKETPKPFSAFTKATTLDKDQKGEEGAVGTVKAEMIVEVIEGPMKIQAKKEDVLRCRVKASKDGAQGFLVTRDENDITFAEVSDKHYQCASVTGITDDEDMAKCKVLRKLKIGEAVELLGEPVENEEGVKRVKCKAVADGMEGWAAISGAKGAAFLKPATKYHVIKKEATLLKSAKGEAVRELEVDEIVEVLSGPNAEKVDPPLRTKGRVVGDEGVVGWFPASSARSCKPSYACKKATPLHETSAAGDDAKVVRQIDVGEPLDLIELGDKNADVFRIKVRAEKDGQCGWVTVKDATATYVVAA